MQGKLYSFDGLRVKAEVDDKSRLLGGMKLLNSFRLQKTLSLGMSTCAINKFANRMEKTKALAREGGQPFAFSIRPLDTRAWLAPKRQKTACALNLGKTNLTCGSALKNKVAYPCVVWIWGKKEKTHVPSRRRIMPRRWKQKGRRPFQSRYRASRE